MYYPHPLYSSPISIFYFTSLRLLSIFASPFYYCYNILYGFYPFFLSFRLCIFFYCTLSDIVLPISVSPLFNFPLLCLSIAYTYNLSFLILFTRDRSNNITTKLDDKRDAFGFHIVNFPFMSSNIPSAPAYGVYASQLIRYARCCSSYSDFLIRHRALVKRLLSQDYKVNRLSNTFKKFYGRHTDLVGQYKKNVCQMFADSIS